MNIHAGFINDKNNLNFAENLKYCPDYNLFMEISSRSKIGVLKDFLVKYRVSDNSLSRSTLDIVSTEIKFTLDNIYYGDYIIIKLPFKNFPFSFVPSL